MGERGEERERERKREGERDSKKREMFLCTRTASRDVLFGAAGAAAKRTRKSERETGAVAKRTRERERAREREAGREGEREREERDFYTRAPHLEE